MMLTDTKRVEIKNNKEFCDDRYIGWQWAIRGIAVLILIIGGAGITLGRWGMAMENEVAACRDFRHEYQAKIDNVQANMDTVKTILRERIE